MRLAPNVSARDKHTVARPLFPRPSHVAGIRRRICTRQICGRRTARFKATECSWCLSIRSRCVPTRMARVATWSGRIRLRRMHGRGKTPSTATVLGWHLSVRVQFTHSSVGTRGWRAPACIRRVLTAWLGRADRRVRPCVAAVWSTCGRALSCTMNVWCR